MKKVLTATTILLPRENHAKCPIYEHEGKFYIKANKPNVGAYEAFYLDKIEYAEVEKVGLSWFTK